jgi:hypothetical protein
MAFDFSTDRQHLVVADVELREKKADMEDPTLEEIYENEDPYAHEHLTKMKKWSKMYTFKLKTVRYQDCPCHHKLVSAVKQRRSPGQLKSPDNAKKAVANQQHSSFSFYTDMFKM